MSQKQLIVLQIMSIASIPSEQLEAYDLSNLDPEYHKTCTDLWTPVPHTAYNSMHLLDSPIEAVDIKTMAIWSVIDDEDTQIEECEDQTAIKVNGDWYVVIDEFGEYDWL